MTAQRPLPGLPVSGSHAGKLRSATGREAEAAVEAAHRAAVALGQASPCRRGDPGIRVGANGRAVFRDSAAVDYFATLRPSGRSLVMEVKSLDGDRWSYEKLAHDQAVALNEARDAGALALLVIVRQGRLYPMPWPEVRAAWWAWHDDPGRRPGQRCWPGTASMPFDLIAPWAVRPGKSYLSAFLETRP